MNVAAASSPPALPVADGSTAPAGQAGEAATGFDALLALVAGLAAPGEGETADGALAAASDKTPDTNAAPADPTTDPMLAALAALMTPPTPVETNVQTKADTGAAPAQSAPPTAALIPDLAAASAPMLPPADVSAPGTEAAQAPAAPAFALDAAATLKADKAPVAAPALTESAPTGTAPAAAASPVAAAAPAPTAAVVAQSAPASSPAKSETPARAAEPSQPAVKAAASTAPAEAVKTDTEQAVAAVAPAADQGSSSGAGSSPTPAPAEPAAASAPGATAATAAPAEPVRTAEAAPLQAAPPAPVRGSPETVAKLSADILKRLDGRSTRFELALDPAGLGRVDVKVEIGAHGHVTAAMSFDTPQAAAELRSRAGELRSALQQAGFDLPENALSFDVGGQAGGDGRGAQTAWDHEDRGHRGPAFAGRAFEAVLNGAESLGADLSLRLGAARADGVDIRI